MYGILSAVCWSAKASEFEVNIILFQYKIDYNLLKLTTHTANRPLEGFERNYPEILLYRLT